ncbi:cobalamin-binding protein [Halomonas marinisediminis]|uniref:cobalamin-binding protein n=1 Tax=Halomonas marinisediminis TaxID=2546095 RepID=UPI00197AE7CA|nr:cobalamin-binding protein [Halomonas marinisediminis]
MITRRLSRLLLAGLALLPLAAAQARADICAVDALDREVCLERPASRIAALSPGATELAFAAGAGDRVVAAVEYSDYPPEALKIPRVGSHGRLDLERLLALTPDLVIGWVTGNPAEQLERLEALGMAVFYIEPRNFDEISATIEQLARFADTREAGEAEAEQFRREMAALAERHAQAEPVSVFYQVWDQPLMTINDRHWIGQVIALCGGTNVFGELERLAPRLDEEALLAANPEVILAGGRGEDNRDWLAHWREYPSLTAVAQDNLFFVPPSLIQRPTPRLLEGASMVCEQLDRARARREGEQ